MPVRVFSERFNWGETKCGHDHPTSRSIMLSKKANNLSTRFISLLPGNKMWVTNCLTLLSTSFLNTMPLPPWQTVPSCQNKPSLHAFLSLPHFLPKLLLVSCVSYFSHCCGKNNLRSKKYLVIVHYTVEKKGEGRGEGKGREGMKEEKEEESWYSVYFVNSEPWSLKWTTHTSPNLESLTVTPRFVLSFIPDLVKLTIVIIKTGIYGHSNKTATNTKTEQ